jgi:hypothetical protein
VDSRKLLLTVQGEYFLWRDCFDTLARPGNGPPLRTSRHIQLHLLMRRCSGGTTPRNELLAKTLLGVVCEVLVLSFQLEIALHTSHSGVRWLRLKRHGGDTGASFPPSICWSRSRGWRNYTPTRLTCENRIGSMD